MRVILDTGDLRPEFKVEFAGGAVKQAISTDNIRYGNFNEVAQAAIRVAGSAMFHGDSGKTSRSVYPPAIA